MAGLNIPCPHIEFFLNNFNGNDCSQLGLFYSAILYINHFLTSIASILALNTSDFYSIRANFGTIATLFVASASAYVLSIFRAGLNIPSPQLELFLNNFNEIIVHNWVHFTLQFYTSIFLTNITSILALYASDFYSIRTNVGNIATL